MGASKGVMYLARSRFDSICRIPIELLKWCILDRDIGGHEYGECEKVRRPEGGW